MKKEITSQEWMFLLTGGMASGDDPPNPAKDWLLDKSWGELNRLGKIEVFNGIVKHFLSNTKDWRELFEALEPHKFKLPGPFAERLTPFQKLLVYRCIRPDKVVPAMQDFVTLKLGPQFVIPPSFNLDACYKDSSATCPLIFVLSAGSDPTAALLSYAGAFPSQASFERDLQSSTLNFQEAFSICEILVSQLNTVLPQRGSLHSCDW